MALLNRKQILSAEDLHGEVIEVPEWGGAVRIAQLSMAELQALVIESDPEHLKVHDGRVRLLARCIVDDKGDRLFGENDLKNLGEKNWVVLDRLAEVARRVNALNRLAVDDAEKNSAPEPSGDSSLS